MQQRIRLTWVLTSAFALALSAMPAAAERATNTLRLAAGQPVQTVSYYYDPSPDTVFESDAVYDGLVSYDVTRGEVQPLLAKSWRRIDPQTLEFTLRDDVTWQDGAPFAVTDAVDTLRWLSDPQTVLRFKQNWSWIDKVEAVGTDKLRVTAKQPTPFDLTRFAYVTAILPSHQPGTPQEKGRRPIGTGPYRVAQLDDFKGIILERNEAYRHGSAAKPGSNIGRIAILPIPEEGTRIAELLAGNLDMVQIAYEQAQALTADPRFAMTIVPGTGFMYVAYDAQGRSGAKPVTDERVRRALAMAIDKPALLRLMAGDATIAQPEAMCWKSQAGCDYSLPLPPYDPAGAKKLLAEAGYPDGFDIEITSFTGPPATIAEAVSGQWHAIGVRATVEKLPLVAYRKKQQEGRIQVMVAAWPAGNIPDVASTVDSFFAAGPADYSGDQVLHDLAQESASAMNPAARKVIGRRMFDRATEHAYFLPIGPYPTVLVHTKEIVVTPATRFAPLGFDVSDINWK